MKHEKAKKGQKDSKTALDGKAKTVAYVNMEFIGPAPDEEKDPDPETVIDYLPVSRSV